MNMKKKLSLLLIFVCMIFADAKSVTVTGHLRSYGNHIVDGINYEFHKYTYSDGTVKYCAEVQSKEDGYSGRIHIPNIVHTKVGLDPAHGSVMSDTPVEEDFIVVSIKEGAFKDCTQLLSFSYSDSLEEIGKSAFEGCTNLSYFGKVTWNYETHIKSIGERAFFGCSELDCINIGDSIKRIDVQTFEGCTSLTEIMTARSLSRIDRRAFAGCSSLSSIFFMGIEEYKLEIIDSEAFLGCSSIEYFKFPISVKGIGAGVFKNCTGLKTVELSSKMTNLNSEAFMGCTNLKRVLNTENLKALYSSVFEGCVSLTEFTFPDGLFDVYSNAFKNSGIESVELPEGTKTIHGNAFQNCKHLKYVKIPSSVIEFDGRDSFVGCDSLVKIKSEIKNPKGNMQNHNFDENAYNTAMLVVPKGTINVYKSANFWKYFKCLYEEGSEPSTDPDSTIVSNPYVVYNDGTLTFYCDNQRDSRQGTTYELTGIEWYVNAKNITNVVFDASFANARPTSTSEWFSLCENLTGIQGLGYLNTSEVTNMRYMFFCCKGLTSLDLSGFNTAKVTNMAFMFNGCSGLTSLDLSNFNTANVTTMDSMFEFCHSLTSLDVSSFNTAKVTIMYNMFSFCGSLTSLDVSHFNTVNVISMGSMFNNCSSLTSLDISNFNTAKVTGMAFMFNGCSKLTKLTIGNRFVTTEQMACSDVFTGCSSLNTVTFIGDIPSSINSKFFNGVGSASNPATLDVLAEYRDHYAAKFDGNKFFGGYFKLSGGTEPVGDGEPYVVFNDGTLTFYCDNQRSSRQGTKYELNEGNKKPGWSENANNITTVVFDSSFANARPKSTYYWFRDAKSLSDIVDVKYLNTSNVTNMSYMFYGCSGLMSLDVSKFVTSNVKDMEQMFDGCSGLTSLDVSNFDTSNVTDMFAMFRQCSNLTSLDVSKFNTSNVTSMFAMFRHCSGLTSLDVSNFDTSNVTSMRYMFFDCSRLTTIYAGDKWSTANVTSGEDMFSGCTNLVGGNGTKYNANHIDVEYARIDKAGALGYFTVKNGGTEPVGDGEPYAVLSSDNTVLTFYYDDKKESRGGMSVGPFSISTLREWNSHSQTVKEVVFDNSFSNCTTLTSTARWFTCFNELTTITGLENLKTDNVTDMVGMFSLCSSLTTLDVSGFKTNNVTNMAAMFEGCYSLTNLDLSGFNTKSLKQTWSMFYNCSNLQTIWVDNENWITAQIAESDKMFDGCTKLVGGNGTKYDPNHTDVKYARIDKTGAPGYFTAKNGGTESVSDGEPYVVFNDYTLTFYYDDQQSKRSGTIYKLNEADNDPEWVIDDNNRNVEKVVFDASFAKARPTTTYSWFLNCDYLREIEGMEYLNTSEVKNMHTMFAFCRRLTSVDVSHFDTQKVLDMGAMFSNCTKLSSLDVSHFDTGNLWSMMSMFYNCQSLTELDLSSFNTSQVDYMSYLFCGCCNLKTLYLGSGFTSTNSVSCEETFADCSNLSKVVFTGDIPACINGTFFESVGTADRPVKLDVPEQFVANYEAKFDGNMFYGGYFTMRFTIVPCDDNGSKDYVNGNGEIDESTNLNGTVIGNVFYNIAPENGGYSSAEGCLVVTQPSSEDEFANEDPFGDDFKGKFTGIVIMVQSGSGIVKVEAETIGSMTLMVKVGNNSPIKMSFQGKSTLAIPYNVDRPSYVYIYAGDAKVTRAISENALKIYSVSWESSTSEIRDHVMDSLLFDVYSLSGTVVKKGASSLNLLPKGVYIVNGRKVVVK